MGCAVSKEDGAGIEDVNSGTGELNEPLILSSLSWQISKSIRRILKSTRTRRRVKTLAMAGRNPMN